MAEAKAVEPVAAPKGKKTLLIVAIIGVLLLLVLIAIGVVGFLLLRTPADVGSDVVASQSEEAPKKKEKKKADHGAPPVFEKLQTITANLNSAEEEAVVQTDVVLELPDAETQTALKNILPRVQAEVIKLIRSKTPADLRTVAGTDKLAAEIQGTVNRLLDVTDKDEGVQSVNFTTFIMQ
ncbi:flagellar basal body-associated FliL family protein [Chitiniphilus eburneus]|nr:flagellar basal body-associated FliL family protein [Chitiniphilus eburneus]